MLFNEICSLIGPGSETLLKHDVCYDEIDEWKNVKDIKTEWLLRNLSDLYLKEEDKEFRLHYLSHMVTLLSSEEMKDYVPITPYLYEKALKYASNPLLTRVPHAGYERWNDEQLIPFMKFITSPYVVTGLPFGRKTIVISPDETLDIPSLLRTKRHKQIIDMYTKKMKKEEKAELILPLSTMYKILKHCVATRSKAITCVDYFLVEATEVC
uniref:Uncharacterized protein n=1 Tax=Panagrolaimus superbus TaxID=310955 RepID=A0A914Y6K6_9BILA